MAHSNADHRNIEHRGDQLGPRNVERFSTHRHPELSDVLGSKGDAVRKLLFPGQQIAKESRHENRPKAFGTVTKANVMGYIMSAPEAFRHGREQHGWFSSAYGSYFKPILKGLQRNEEVRKTSITLENGNVDNIYDLKKSLQNAFRVGNVDDANAPNISILPSDGSVKEAAVTEHAKNVLRVLDALPNDDYYKQEIFRNAMIRGIIEMYRALTVSEYELEARTRARAIESADPDAIARIAEEALPRDIQEYLASYLEKTDDLDDVTRRMIIQTLLSYDEALSVRGMDQGQRHRRIRRLLGDTIGPDSAGFDVQENNQALTSGFEDLLGAVKSFEKTNFNNETLPMIEEIQSEFSDFEGHLQSLNSAANNAQRNAARRNLKDSWENIEMLVSNLKEHVRNADNSHVQGEKRAKIGKITNVRFKSNPRDNDYRQLGNRWSDAFFTETAEMLTNENTNLDAENRVKNALTSMREAYEGGNDAQMYSDIKQSSDFRKLLNYSEGDLTKVPGFLTDDRKASIKRTMEYLTRGAESKSAAAEHNKQSALEIFIDIRRQYLVEMLGMTESQAERDAIAEYHRKHQDQVVGRAGIEDVANQYQENANRNLIMRLGKWLRTSIDPYMGNRRTFAEILETIGNSMDTLSGDKNLAWVKKLFPKTGVFGFLQRNLLTGNRRKGLLSGRLLDVDGNWMPVSGYYINAERIRQVAEENNVPTSQLVLVRRLLTELLDKSSEAGILETVSDSGLFDYYQVLDGLNTVIGQRVTQEVFERMGSNASFNESAIQHTREFHETMEKYEKDAANAVDNYTAIFGLRDRHLLAAYREGVLAYRDYVRECKLYGEMPEYTKHEFINEFIFEPEGIYLDSAELAKTVYARAPIRTAARMATRFGLDAIDKVVGGPIRLVTNPIRNWMRKSNQNELQDDAVLASRGEAKITTQNDFGSAEAFMKMQKGAKAANDDKEQKAA